MSLVWKVYWEGANNRPQHRLRKITELSDLYIDTGSSTCSFKITIDTNSLIRSTTCVLGYCYIICIMFKAKKRRLLKCKIVIVLGINLKM